MGEGAGMLLLEDLNFALERGAPILAELVGYGSTADAYHMTEPAPGGEGLVRAMECALQRAGLRPEEVQYINAHGTATRLNDATETQAIKTCFALMPTIWLLVRLNRCWGIRLVLPEPSRRQLLC